MLQYLHYSYNYVVVMLSLRNILRCLLTMFLLTLSKMVETPGLLHSTGLTAGNTTTDLSQVLSLHPSTPVIKKKHDRVQ